MLQMYLRAEINYYEFHIKAKLAFKKFLFYVTFHEGSNMFKMR